MEQAEILTALLAATGSSAGTPLIVVK
jgi:hypothetical protein